MGALRRGRRSGPGQALATAGLVTALLSCAAAPAAATGLPRTAPDRDTPCTADTGPYQWEPEEYLALPCDGRQSPADCTAIRAFQQREGLDPADGSANLATYRASLVIEERRHPNKDGPRGPAHDHPPRHR
ncbi:hypothetical protein AB0F18_01165 [Streptomyces sp. NPDC029216]|uniref:peptidoglycan-binding domain-containing protein n=1 Tax=Streptomyces sp. NPDC029216 TaxID=3154701 RepID=UPI0033EB6D76